MNVNELAFLLYCYYYGINPYQDGMRKHFFEHHAMELADFMDFRTNRRYVPPVDAFYECFCLSPRNGMPLSDGLEEYLSKWVKGFEGYIECPPLPELPSITESKMLNRIPLPGEDIAVEKPQANGDTATAKTAGQSDFFVCKPANQWIREAAERPNPEPLFMTLWFQGEHCCLFADSNIGKSILSVQIATAIAPTKTVLLFDFELSDKMFQMRYTDEETKQLYNFPPNLFRLELNPESKEIVSSNLEDVIIKNIEQAANDLNAKVIIIDNMTWLSSQLEKGDAAGQLMQSLQGLTRKYGWSILSISHTPKRNLSNPLTQNDLGGSKKLMNFFDSAFAIARSRKDESLVYVKQIKVRNDVLRYGEDNVIVYEIVKNGAFLCLNQIGYATEKEHLQNMDKQEENALKDAIIALQSEGKKYKEIGKELGISPSKISRILNKQAELN